MADGPAGAALVRVKVCGVTREEDALLAAELGAFAVGFVLWPGSPRHVTPALVRRIASRLPPLVVAVGVFVDPPLPELRRIIEQAGLGAVQLHGSEPPEVAGAVARPVIKALAPGTVDVDRWLASWPETVVPLLDAHDPVRRGGTGRTVDWTAAAGFARRRRVILSGGLVADNVAGAIRHVRPWAVDVSSGVERAPGIKDAERMRAFFRAVRSAIGESEFLGDRSTRTGAPAAAEERG